MSLLPQKKLVILCDQDAILADCIGHWLAVLKTKYGVDCHYSEVTQWSVHKAAPYVGKLTPAQVYGVLREPGFFRNMPVIPGAMAALKQLNDLHTVFIVTGPSGPISIIEKYEWLAEHASFIKEEQIITCKADYKMMIKADVIIDDHPGVLENYPKVWPGSLAVGIEYRYNKHLQGSSLAALPGKYPDTELAWNKILDLIDVYSKGL